MKVYVDQNGPYRGLRRRLELEGDTLVQEEDAELVIRDPLETSPGFLECKPELEPTHVVSKWFHEGKYLDQTFVGIPMVGLMDQGLGPRVSSGMAGRYIQQSAFDSYFAKSDSLQTMLREYKHSGPVSLTFSNHDLVALQTGVPFWGLYALLEGIRGSKLSTWWQAPSRLYESWCGSLLVSRFPYPSDLKAARTTVFGVEESSVWMLDGEKNRDGFVVEGTEVAVVTSRGNKDQSKLNDVHFRILRLARQIKLEGAQYRTDMSEWVRERWARLREWAIV